MAVFRKLKQSTLRSSDRLAIDTRPGHLSFNPSEWRFRIPILILALAGFCIAIYLAIYQWGIVKRVWEPFFKDGSERVLHSFVSRLLPVPDGFLGALGYVADLATGLISGSARWRTMPRMVLIYGLTVCLVGAIALVLALLQPLVFHAGCTLCLVSTLLSICIVWLARHEVWTSFHHIRDLPRS